MASLAEARPEVAPIVLSRVEAAAVDWAAKKLAETLRQVSAAQLVDAAARNVDITASLPFPVTLPAWGVAQAGVALVLKAADPRIYEAIRIRLCELCPAQGRVLGGDTVWPWYLETMDALRVRLLRELGGAV